MPAVESLSHRSLHSGAALVGFALAALVTLSAPTAEASGEASTGKPAMREGAAHAGPLGWRVLCQREPGVCAAPTNRRPGAVGVLGEGGLTALKTFNKRINHALKPAEDQAAYGALDLWRLPSPGDYADCEDYVLAKRAQLLAAGWPAEAVLIAVVEGTTTPYHAVLVLRTDQGEFVLDNLTDEILEWRASGYTWVVRQSARAPDTWVRVQS